MLNKSLSASSDFLKGLAMISLVYVHYVRLEYGLIDNIMWIWDPQVLHKIVTEAAQYSWWSVLLRYFAQVAVTMFFILSSWGLSYSLLARNNDTWLTTKIKTQMLTDANVPSSRIKVVTENGIVYMLGLVTRREGDLATQVVQNVNGVQKIVRLFESID